MAAQYDEQQIIEATMVAARGLLRHDCAVRAWQDYSIILSVVLPVLVLAERAAPEYREAVRVSSPRRFDFAFLGLTWLVVPAVGVGTGALAAAILRQSPLVGALQRHPLVASVIGGLVADTVFYGLHRFSHQTGILWHLHRVHHAPRELDVVRGFRFHPIDVALQQALPVGAVAAVGVSPAELVPYLLVAFVVTLFAHANLEIPEGVWQRLVVTPAFHRSHHELGREDTNFAAVLPVLDVLFGTASFSKQGRRRFLDPAGRVQV